jgi:hypothetical protein
LGSVPRGSYLLKRGLLLTLKKTTARLSFGPSIFCEMLSENQLDRAKLPGRIAVADQVRDYASQCIFIQEGSAQREDATISLLLQ